MDLSLTKVRCKACGGVYTPVQADGSAYFHVCPPLRDPETGVETLRDGHRDETLATVEVAKPNVLVQGLHSIRRLADDTVHYFETRILHEGAGVEPVKPKE